MIEKVFTCVYPPLVSFFAHFRMLIIPVCGHV